MVTELDAMARLLGGRIMGMNLDRTRFWICTTVRAMGASYGQFCPVPKAMEVLDDRWTLLVARERELPQDADLEIAGPSALRRAVPSWFTLAPAAAVPRPARAG